MNKTIQKGLPYIWKFLYWILKISAATAIVGLILIGLYICFPLQIVGIQNIASSANQQFTLDQIATMAIEKSQQSVTLIAWFIATLISVSAGLVVYFVNSQVDSNRKLEKIGNEFDEAKSLLNELTGMYQLLQQRMSMLPKRIVSLTFAQEAHDRKEKNQPIYDEALQWLNWQKWVLRNEEEGYKSLEAIGGEDLATNLKIIILLEMETIRRNYKDRGDTTPNPSESEILAKLQKLLGS